MALLDPKSKAIERPALNHTLLVLPFAECALRPNGAKSITEIQLMEVYCLPKFMVHRGV
jgi:hypothetical protein